MVINLFKNVSVSNKLFTLKNNNILDIDNSNFMSEDIQNIDENLLSIYKGKEFDTVLIKAFSFQPNINGFEILVKERKSEIEAGILKLKNITRAKEVKFLVTGKSKGLSEELSSLGEVVKVKAIDELYEEKLIERVLGDKNNKFIIEDLLNIAYLGQESLNYTKLYITVYGSCINGNKLISVKEGTTLEEIFKLLNGDISKLKKVVVGGSLNGEVKYDLSFKVNKESKSILFLTEKDSPTQKSISCIRCAKCLRVCKEGLNPIKLMELWEKNDKEEFLKFSGNKCIECGLCSYVCPSNLEVTQAIKTGKIYIGK